VAKPDEAPTIIFSMLGVSKKIERKEILRDISLSFFYGAKFDVLGLNGSVTEIEETPSPSYAIAGKCETLT
jgi:ABC-type molybdenum transport system ATPase subunit/photorepair protein PhrA